MTDKNGKPSMSTLNTVAHVIFNDLLDGSGKDSMSRDEIVNYLADHQTEFHNQAVRELRQRGLDPSAMGLKDVIFCPICSRPSEAPDEQDWCQECRSNYDRAYELDFRFQTLLHPTPGDNILADFYLKGLHKLAMAIAWRTSDWEDQVSDASELATFREAFNFMTGIPVNDCRFEELVKKYSEEE
jgi:hypothetical protein